MLNADKIKGCLLGGAVGDALGYPIKFMSMEEIRQIYGPEGRTDYVLRNGLAQISDDTQMTLFTADGLLHERNNVAKSWVRSDKLIHDICRSYHDWFLTQTCNYPLHPSTVTHSKLVHIPEMFARRSPGSTCMNALSNSENGSIGNPLNDSKGCGGLMRVAPIALALYDAPLSDRRIAFLGAETAAITHGHDLGYMPAAALIFLLLDLLHGKSIFQAIDKLDLSLLSLFLLSEHLTQLLVHIKLAQKLALEKADNEEAFKLLGKGWVAEETLAIAIFCALKYADNFEKGVLAAINHSGDSDSTGSVTGQILGTALGLKAIPEKYIKPLELKDVILKTADNLQKFTTAVKSDWKTLDMPSQHDTFILDRVFTPEQMDILRKGFVPKSMNDHWFRYMKNNTLFAHRSWTGYCIYIIEFSADNHHKVTVNRDLRQNKRTNSEEDKEELNRLLGYWSRVLKF